MNSDKLLILEEAKKLYNLDFPKCFDLLTLSETYPYIVYSESTGCLVIWDISKHQIIKTLQRHESPLCYLSCFKNFIVSADNHGFVKFWHIHTLEIFQEATLGSECIQQMALFENEKDFICSTQNLDIFLYNNGKFEKIYQGCSKFLDHFSLIKNKFLVLRDNSEIFIISIEKKTKMFSVSRQFGFYCLKSFLWIFNSKQTMLLTFENDSIVIEKGEHKVSCVSEEFYLVDNFQECIIFNILHEEIGRIKEKIYYDRCLIMGERIITCNNDTIFVHKIFPELIVNEILFQTNGWVSRLKKLGNSKFCSIATNMTIKIWDCESKSCIKALSLDTSTVLYAFNSEVIIIQNYLKKIKYFSLGSMKTYKLNIKNSIKIISLKLFEKNKILILKDENRFLECWSLELGKKIKELSPKFKIKTFNVTPDEKLLFLFFNDNYLKLWIYDIYTRKPICQVLKTDYFDITIECVEKNKYAILNKMNKNIIFNPNERHENIEKIFDFFYAIFVIPDSNKFVCINNSTIEIFITDYIEDIRPRFSECVKNFNYQKKENLLMIYHLNKYVNVWDLNSQEVIFRIEINENFGSLKIIRNLNSFLFIINNNQYFSPIGKTAKKKLKLNQDYIFQSYSICNKEQYFLGKSYSGIFYIINISTDQELVKFYLDIKSDVKFINFYGISNLYFYQVLSNPKRAIIYNYNIKTFTFQEVTIPHNIGAIKQTYDLKYLIYSTYYINKDCYDIFIAKSNNLDCKSQIYNELFCTGEIQISNNSKYLLTKIKKKKYVIISIEKASQVTEAIEENFSVWCAENRILFNFDPKCSHSWIKKTQFMFYNISNYLDLARKKTLGLPNPKTKINPVVPNISYSVEDNLFKTIEFKGNELTITPYFILKKKQGNEKLMENCGIQYNQNMRKLRILFIHMRRIRSK